MAQSLARVITHIIFSTKGREPVIPPAVRADLAAYIGGIFRQVDSLPLGVTCVADHVHALCCLSKTRSLAQIVQEIKVGSSKWVKGQGGLLQLFHWQNGYGAFSVSQSNPAAVQEYVRNQEAHHHRMTFQEEFREFLRRHEIEFDERYVWD